MLAACSPSPAELRDAQLDAGQDLVPWPHPPIHGLFAPGTPEEVFEQFHRNFDRHGHGRSLAGGSGHPQPRGGPPLGRPPGRPLGPDALDQGNGNPGFDAFTFNDSDRWHQTATDGQVYGQGNPTTLTWSIVPDGTSIYGYAGELATPSNLRSFLNGIYGSIANWLPVFQQVFDRWSAVTGVNYVNEPNDDGGAWTLTQVAKGQLGVRGDVRIAGHRIDGNGGILAYNFFPDWSDMVIDTGDSAYTNTASNSLLLRNVLAHEAGHGLGIDHADPLNNTKLMEAYLNLNFDGPQFDDILAAHRGYGDKDEQAGGNDTYAAATNLGPLSVGQTITIGADALDSVVAATEVDFVSLDDNSDSDFYSFTVSTASQAAVLLRPVGPSYLTGPQNGATALFDARAQNDLSLALLDTNGTTVLASSNAAGLGGSELVAGLNLPAAGTYYVRVTGTSNAAQFYQLDVSLRDSSSAGISGQLWDDDDGDGVRDASESPLEGWTVFLDNNRNGLLDAGEISTTTYSGGQYYFPDLVPGTTYTVAQVIPSGWQQTTPGKGAGAALTFVSNWDGASGGGQAAQGGDDIVPLHEDEGGDGGEKGSGGPGLEYADVWIEGNFAYLGHYETDSRVDIVDLTNPAQPVLATTWIAPTAGMRIQDVKVIDGIGYFPSDSGGGMYIVNLANPYSPVNLAYIGTGQGGHNQIHNVSIDGGYLYQADSRSSVIKVFDVSNPAAPVFVRNIDASGTVHDVTARNGRLFASIINNPGRTNIFDVSNVASSVTLLGSFDSGSYSHSNWPTKNGDYLVSARETSGGDVRIYNISNPASPTLAATLTAASLGISTFSPHNPVVDGDLLYVSWYQAGAQMFDISNPASPVHLGSFDTFPGAVSGYDGNWGVAVWPDNPGYIAASDMQTGLYVLATPTHRAHVVTPAAGEVVSGQNFGTDDGVIDNSQAGFTIVSGTWGTGSLGYLGNNRNNPAGTGADKARWTFSGLTPGQYRVSATWPESTNRATNSPFTVYNGATPLATVPVNQQLAPNDYSILGAWWENLGGTYSISNSSIVVELTDAANGYVIADAVRIERIGDLLETLTVTVSPSSFLEVAGASAATGTVTRSGPTVGDLLVTLSSSDTGEATVPATVTILDGQASANFAVNAVDDALADGTQSVTITGSAAGFTDGTYSVDVLDDEPPGIVQIIDNSQAGFTIVSGTWSTGTVGYLGNNRNNAAGTGADKARWTFSGLPTGQYRVSASWPESANRATNSPFTVFNGATPLATVPINQELAPNDFSASGTSWEDLGGPYNISGSTIVVELTDAANEYVIADAVRIERVGDLLETLTVTVSPSSFLENAGASAATGTVTRSGSTAGDLLVSLSSSDTSEATVPATVTILDGQASANFAVNAVDDALADGTQSATITGSAAGFTDGSFNVSVLDDEPAVVIQVIDNSQAGFTIVSGTWGTGSVGYLGNNRNNAAGSGADKARWTFSGLPAGQYRVSATWPEQANRATNSPFTVFNGATPLATVPINQELAPNDFSAAGASWEDLGGPYNISGSTIVVELTDAANEYVIADAVRIERVGDLLETLTVTVSPSSFLENAGASAATGTVTRSGSTAGDLLVTLSGSDTGEATVPATVTILNGQASANFAVNAVDDALADGTQSATITGSAAGFTSGSYSVDVLDDEPAVVIQVIDNSQAGFTIVSGSWSTGAVGYLGNNRNNVAGTGADKARWTFTGLPTGQYRVSATWPELANRATNSPFTVFNGATPLATVPINQELAPNDFSASGASWEDLGGPYNITGSTIVVELTDAANEYVIADAVRIERIGNLLETLTVAVSPSSFLENAGASAATGTVTRSGSTAGDLLVALSSSDTGEATIPATVTILDGQASANFAVSAVDDALADGTQSATITGSAAGFTDGSFSVSVLDDEPAVVIQVIDNSQAGFTIVSGTWSTGTVGYLGNNRNNAAGTGADKARWTFTGLPAGQYRVSAAWPESANRATNSPFTVFNGASPLATVPINQELAPNDFIASGASWEDLGGPYSITGSTIVVELTDAANEYVIADAVRIERIGDLP